jgi:hypothetical protein
VLPGLSIGCKPEVSATCTCTVIFARVHNSKAQPGWCRTWCLWSPGKFGFGGAAHNHTGSLFALPNSLKAVDVRRTVTSLHAVACPAVCRQTSKPANKLLIVNPCTCRRMDVLEAPTQLLQLPGPCCWLLGLHQCCAGHHRTACGRSRLHQAVIMVVSSSSTTGPIYLHAPAGS